MIGAKRFRLTALALAGGLCMVPRASAAEQRIIQVSWQEGRSVQVLFGNTHGCIDSYTGFSFFVGRGRVSEGGKPTIETETFPYTSLVVFNHCTGSFVLDKSGLGDDFADVKWAINGLGEGKVEGTAQIWDWDFSGRIPGTGEDLTFSVTWNAAGRVTTYTGSGPAIIWPGHSVVIGMTAGNVRDVAVAGSIWYGAGPDLLDGATPFYAFTTRSTDGVLIISSTP